MTVGPMHVHHSYRALRDAGAAGPTPVTPECTRDQAAELAVQLDRLTAHLAGMEASARAAMPPADRVYNWAPFSMDTGLTEAQEDFVDRWSPQDVLNHCRAQRELIAVLKFWLLTHDSRTDLELAVALVSTSTDGLPT